MAIFIPRLPQVGGAEVCLRDFLSENASRFELRLFEVLPQPLRLRAYIRALLGATRFIVTLSRQDRALFLFWSTVPLMLVPTRATKTFFVNSTTNPRWFQRLGERIAVTIADYIVADSENVRSVLQHRYPRARAKISTIPFIPMMPRISVCLRADKPVRLAYVGRWSAEKGIHLVRALSAAISDRRQSFAMTVVTDDAVEADAAGMESMGTRILVAPPRDEIAHILAETHFLVILSDYEGLGLASYEAMLSGAVPLSWGQGHFNSIAAAIAPETALEQSSFSPTHTLDLAAEIVASGRYAAYSETLHGIAAAYEPFAHALATWLDQEAHPSRDARGGADRFGDGAAFPSDQSSALPPG